MADVAKKVSKSLFKEIMTKGRGVSGSFFNLKFLPNPALKSPLITVVVSSKVAKKAVDRNRLKRRVRASMDEFKPEMTSLGAIIVFTKPLVVTARMESIKNELRLMLSSSGILKK